MSHFLLRRLGAPALALAFVLGALAPAFAGNLLVPLFGPLAPKVDVAADTLRQRLVTISPAALAATPAPLGRTVRLALFPDVVVTLTRTGLENAYGGGRIWSGRSVSGPKAEASLVVRYGRITGQISVGSRIFEINPVGRAKAHLVREVKVAAQPPTDFVAAAAAVPTAATAPSVARAASATTTITVLFGYTDAAYGAYPNMQERVNLAVSLANKAFSTSGVAIKIEVAGMLWVQNYDEARLQELKAEPEDEQVCPTEFSNNDFPAISYKANLKYAALGCSYLYVLPAERDRVKADLVTLIVKRDDLCSIYYRPDTDNLGRSYPVVADGAYSVVTASCIGSYVFSQAIAGNMGIQKDRFVTYPGYKRGYSYGYVDLVGKFRDVMSENARCEAAGITCTLVNAFSNPNYKYRGRPFGIPFGQPYAADAARALNENRLTVAANR